MSIREKIETFKTEASQIILGKDREINLALCCILARGHLLIEDIPGMGKTTLVMALAKLFNLDVSRIQFTNDLLPADILGSSIFDPEKKQFVFHPGPIFAQLVLADELNRATPKTQSACLQAMEERRITVDGKTHELPHPFVFVATQNPRQQVGTFPLPESQLDRFLMRIDMGYPDRAAEKKLLLQESRHDLIEHIKPVMTPEDLHALQQEIKQVHVSEKVITYLQDLVAHTRESQRSLHGLSPRASIGFLQAAKAWAYLRGSKFVLPEDIQAVAIPIMSHRLSAGLDLSGKSGIRTAEEIIKTVPVAD